MNSAGLSGRQLRPSRRLWGVMAVCLCLWSGVSQAQSHPEVTVSPPDDLAFMLLQKGYAREEDGDLSGAIQALEEANRIPGVSDSTRRTIRRSLAWIYVDVDRPRDAIRLADELLEQETEAEDRAALFEIRGNAWSVLGNRQQAERDLQEAEFLWENSFNPENFLDRHSQMVYPGSWSAWLDNLALHVFNGGRRSWETARTGLFATATLALWGILSLVNVPIGHRQMKEGAGTFPRLALIAVYAAFLACLPVIACLVIVSWFPIGIDYWPQLALSVCGLLHGFFWLTLYLRPPVVSSVTRGPLPLVDDPEFLTRLREIAERVGIPPPTARMLPSGGAVLGITAFAGGMPAPSIIVSDGVLLRLSPLERDAIVAHELGHIANRTLWVYPGIAPASAAAAVVASVWLQPLVAILYGLALQVGLTRIISRVFEYDCDRRAGRAIGTKETITALDKTYAVSPIGNSGWWSFLAFATATHPSIEERLEALHRLAGPEETVSVTWSETAARRRRHGARLAAGVWLAVMVAVPLLPETTGVSLVRILLLVGLACGPFLLIQKAIRQDVRTDMRRRQARPAGRFGWLWIIVGVLSAAWVSAQLVNEPDRFWMIAGGMLTLGIAGVLLAVFLAWLKILLFNQRNPHMRLLRAIYAGQWDEAIAIGEKAAKQFRDHPAAKNDLALAQWMAGRRETALTELAHLRRRFPHFKQPWLTAAILLMDQGDYRQALELLREVAAALKQDSGPHMLAARCHRRLGDLPGLVEECRRVTDIDPTGASGSALRALVALDQGDADAARSFLAEAEQRAPGDTFVLLIRAELEWKAGHPDAARGALADAERMLAATPLAFLRPEYDHVRRLSADGAAPSESEGPTEAVAMEPPSPLDSKDEPDLS